MKKFTVITRCGDLNVYSMSIEDEEGKEIILYNNDMQNKINAFIDGLEYGLNESIEINYKDIIDEWE